jgi:hypothetical protein
MACLKSFGAFFPHDHYIQKIFANVNANSTQGNQEIEISGAVGMNDHSGHFAQCKTLGAGVFAIIEPNPNFGIYGVTATQNSPPPFNNYWVTKTFDKEIEDAVALLSSFEMNYADDDYKLMDMVIGNLYYTGDRNFNGDSSIKSSIKVDGKKVEVCVVDTLRDNHNRTPQTATAKFLLIAKYK